MGDRRNTRGPVDPDGRSTVETLEGRTLFSAAPAGPVFPITGDGTSYWDMAADVQGNSVAVWQTGMHIYARRFDPGGGPLSGAFQVDAAGSGATPAPAVAVNASGTFVVTWDEQDRVNGKWLWNIHARRYDAGGNALGGDFLVTPTAASEQNRPTVAIDDAGDVAIAWMGEQGRSNSAIFAQRYTAAGVKAGKAFQVNGSGSGAAYPSAAMDAGGDFVIAWQDSDGSGTGVYARRYSASGSAAGGQFRVNTTTAGDQSGPRAAMDAAGDFIVGWGGNGAYARRYDAAGAAAGGELLLGSGGGIAVSMDRSGDAVVGWAQPNPGTFTTSIFAQQIDAAGNLFGGSILVTTDTDVGNVRVSAQPDLGFVVGWNRIGFHQGIFGEQYIQPAI
jgi:hypothetical protein